MITVPLLLYLLSLLGGVLGVVPSYLIDLGLIKGAIDVVDAAMLVTCFSILAATIMRVVSCLREAPF